MPPPKTKDSVGASTDSELPFVESLGIHKSPKGWVVVWLKTQGDKVLERDVLSEPGGRSLAMERFKIETIRRLFVAGPLKGVSA